jgi:hypothetical protein
VYGSLKSGNVAAVSAQRLLFVFPLLRHPLCWLLLLVGGGLIVAAGGLAGYQHLSLGAPSEKLYLRSGFDGLESGPHGPFRWTHAAAEIALPQTGPGPLTVHLTLFDGAPAPRALWLTLDGQEIYRGVTRPGGVPYVLDVPATATGETPVLTIHTDPWSPPGDRRVLGVALTDLAAEAPAAAGRARWDMTLLLLAVLALLVAAVRQGVRPLVAALAGLGVLGFAGPLLAYGDVWLNRAAPAILVLSLLAALVIGVGPWPRRPVVIPGGAPFWGAVAVAGLLLLLTLGRFDTGDAEGMFQVTAGLAEDGMPWQHQDHTWIKFGLGQPLATLPLYLLGRTWATVTHADLAQLTRFCVALLNQALIPATALVLFLGARRRYGPSVALALAGTFLLATPAVPYARLAFAEPLSGLLILSGFLLLWVGGPHPRPLSSEERGELDSLSSQEQSNRLPLPSEGRGPGVRLFAAGLCLGMAVLVKPANAIYLPVPALYLAWLLTRRPAAQPPAAQPHDAPTPDALTPDRQPPDSPLLGGEGRGVRLLRGLTLFGLGLLPGLLLTAGYNALRYGSPFVFGYESEGFTTPLPVGLYGLLFSPGKGIIYFAPPVILAPLALVVTWRRRVPQLRAEALCIGMQTGIVLGFHALWSSWEGNIAWGPRLILPLVPLLLWPLGALAPGRAARWAWGLLGAAGFLVAIPGALVDQFYYFDISGVYGVGTVAEYHMLFTPEWSQIIAHWRFLLTGTCEAVLRPTLAQMGLAPGWDTVIPVALVAGTLLALVLALRARDRV